MVFFFVTNNYIIIIVRKFGSTHTPEIQYETWYVSIIPLWIRYFFGLKLIVQTHYDINFVNFLFQMFSIRTQTLSIHWKLVVFFLKIKKIIANCYNQVIVNRKGLPETNELNFNSNGIAWIIALFGLGEPP